MNEREEFLQNASSEILQPADTLGKKHQRWLFGNFEEPS